jgi:hypothetical protein
VANDRSAALLVRVWLEGETGPFRARVTAVGLEAPDDDGTVAVAASPREVIDAVSRWLEDFLHHGSATD